jgi:hypothetical protein
MTEKSRTHHNPNIEYDIGGMRQGALTGIQRKFVLVPSMDLKERCANDNNAKEHVEVVLGWTTAERRFRLESVDDVAQKDLDNVEDEERESKALGHNQDNHNEEFRSTRKHTV